MNNNKIKVRVPGGYLEASESGYGPEYPGISIDFISDKDGETFCLALVEHTESEGDVPAGLIARIYGDFTQDEYTDRVVYSGYHDICKED